MTPDAITRLFKEAYDSFPPLKGKLVGLTRNGPWPRRVGLEGWAEPVSGAEQSPHPDTLETPIAPEPHPQQ